MSESQRTTVRFALSLPITVRVCDSQSHRALSPPFQGELVDVSAGGAKLELSGLGDVMAQLFAPGIIVEFRVQSANLKVATSLFLNITWYRSRQEDNTVHATVGGRFAQAEAADVSALVSYARTQQAAAENPRLGSLWRHPGWVVSGLAAAALVFLVIDDLGLRTQVTRLQDTQQSLESQLRAMQRRLPVPRGEKMETPRPITAAPAVTAAVPATGASPAPVPPTPAAHVPPAPPPASPPSGGAPPLDRALHDLPAGIELASLEIIGQDFIGAVVSKLPAPQRLAIILEFPCDATDGGADVTCRCRIPDIGVKAEGRAEFSCTPERATPRNPAKATVRLRAEG